MGGTKAKPTRAGEELHARQVVEDKDRRLFTLTELVEIFRAELPKGQIPNEDQVAQLAELAVFPHAGSDDDACAYDRDVASALWAPFRRAAFQTREALSEMRAKMPPGDWNKVANRNQGLKALAEALTAMGDLLYSDTENEERRRGPKSDPEKYGHAWLIAEEIKAAMQSAGRQKPISLTSDQGPVARIGAKVIARCLGNNVVPPATFADWVTKHAGSTWGHLG